MALEDVAFDLGDGEKEVLRGDVLVVELGRLFEGKIEDAPQVRANERLGRGAADLRQLAELSRGVSLDLRRRNAELVEDRSDDAPLLPQQRDEEVLGGDF